MAKDLSVVPDLKVHILERDHTMIVVTPGSVMMRCTMCGGVKYLYDYVGGTVGSVRTCACNLEALPAATSTTQPLPYSATVNRTNR